ncbi:hypothetical protein BGZ96_011022 [Linnemannia gamsii]|uniref:Uncharacterized protein n=1 Tax=Linnemannia gamsii TaxID=64522 RepID=A0ABQ7JTB0_9FUNG|nr:hypothetical protein BGZ96_011022 [Linnemannia gamsii]
MKRDPDGTVGGKRVAVLFALEQRTCPWVNNATDSHILGVWLMLKVIEGHPWLTHGRIVKYYSALEPSSSQAASTGGAQELAPTDVDPPRRKVYYIAIFGTQNTDVAPEMVVKEVLYNDDDKFDLDRKM